MHCWHGRLQKAARSRLEQVPHDVVQEFRMLHLAEAYLVYELGSPRLMLDFVRNDFEDFAGAEIGQA